jgi:hypothetical protein
VGGVDGGGGALAGGAGLGGAGGGGAGGAGLAGLAGAGGALAGLEGRDEYPRIVQGNSSRPPSGLEVAVAAVTLRAGRELTARDITEALMGLDPAERPSIVHVVDEIPVTTWYRPLTGPLRAAGIPRSRESRGIWHRDRAEDAYVPLIDEAAGRPS